MLRGRVKKLVALTFYKERMVDLGLFCYLRDIKIFAGRLKNHVKKLKCRKSILIFRL